MEGPDNFYRGIFKGKEREVGEAFASANIKKFHLSPKSTSTKKWEKKN